MVSTKIVIAPFAVSPGQKDALNQSSWRRHFMGTIAILLAFCEGIHQIYRGPIIWSLVFLSGYSEQAGEHKVGSLVIWNAIRLSWPHCDALTVRVLLWFWMDRLYISRVSCQKGPICHAYAWRVGPFWQDTLDIFFTFTSSELPVSMKLSHRMWENTSR